MSCSGSPLDGDRDAAVEYMDCGCEMVRCENPDCRRPIYATDGACRACADGEACQTCGGAGKWFGERSSTVVICRACNGDGYERQAPTRGSWRDFA